MQLRPGALFILGALIAAHASAETAPICAARPGKSTPVCTVPAGHFQIETGLIDWTRDTQGGKRDTSLVLGETAFKYGLSDRSNIEVDVTPWQRSTTLLGGAHEHASGFGDVTVAYKHQLSGEDAAVEVALLPRVKIPTAEHSLGNGKWEAGLLVPIAYSIPNSALSIGMAPELDWVADGDSNGHHLAMAQVVSLGVPASDKLSLSAEVWGQWDRDRAGTVRQYSLDASIGYVPRDNLQLDGGANFGLNRETPDVELYVGVAKEF